jgi:hypothetical protein
VQLLRLRDSVRGFAVGSAALPAFRLLLASDRLMLGHRKHVTPPLNACTSTELRSDALPCNPESEDLDEQCWCRDPSLGGVRSRTTPLLRMTGLVRDNIVGEFSDIGADVLGVNGGGQECPPYTCSPRFARLPDEASGATCALAVAVVGILRWESCARARLRFLRMTA